LIEMFKETTVRQLAQTVDDLVSQTGGRLPDRVVFLKKGEGKSARVFFFHDGGGNVECYAGLSTRLPARLECLGIQAESLPGLAPVNVSIEVLASRYLEIIRQIQPQGPYLLAGWSLGGTLAFECALQLQRLGDSPVFVGLIDAPGPDLLANFQLPPFSLETEREALLRLLPEEDVVSLFTGREDLEGIWRAAAEMIGRKTSVQDLSRRLPEEIRRLVPEWGELPVERALELINRARVFITARSQYVPANRLEAPVIYIGANTSGKAYETAWHAHCEGPVVSGYVDGDHYSMLDSPYLERTAASLARFMSKSAGTTEIN